jgi:hypothetical protein
MRSLPWAGVVFAGATLGLAPSNSPHVVEKAGASAEAARRLGEK